MQHNQFYYSRMQLVESPVSNIGPGTYSPMTKALFNSHSAVFPKGDRFKQAKSSSPGPGAYDLKGETVAVTKFSKASRDIKNTENLPGPGFYDIPQNKSPGKSIIGRNFMKETENFSPGPGSYDFPLHLLQSSSGYSMGRACRDQTSNSSQGPGFLSLGTTLTSPGKTFPKAQRPDLVKYNPFPDPTKFDKPSYIGEGPKFSMLERRFKNATSEVPGPAYYSPKVQMKKYTSSFARQARFNFKSNAVPGPGEYEPTTFKPVTYSFPRQMKEKEESDDEPGPGHYNLPSSFPESSKFKSGKEKLPEATHFY